VRARPIRRLRRVEQKQEGKWISIAYFLMAYAGRATPLDKRRIRWLSFDEAIEALDLGKSRRVLRSADRVISLGAGGEAPGQRMRRAAARFAKWLVRAARPFWHAGVLAGPAEIAREVEPGRLRLIPRPGEYPWRSRRLLSGTPPLCSRRRIHLEYRHPKSGPAHIDALLLKLPGVSARKITGLDLLRQRQDVRLHQRRRRRTLPACHRHGVGGSRGQHCLLQPGGGRCGGMEADQPRKAAEYEKDLSCFRPADFACPDR
jgi:hypothetical protein